MSHRAIEWIHEDIVKPDLNKHQQWRVVKLRNGMQVLIISDEKADQSAASMNVGIGTLSDPVELPGLAHFCEHMSFLGSEKYPSERSMFDVVTPHGGTTNAYTDVEDTNFHFDVDPAHFKDALDVFAQLFICPLFTESAARREINAVNNEFLRHLTDDRWRLRELEKSLSTAGHPYRKFMTGNRKSLEESASDNGINICEALLRFHSEYYSPNLMCLAIYCKESADDMTRYVCELFGGMVNKHITQPCWTEHPYGPEQLRKRVYVVPVQDIRELHLTWPCEDMNDHWQSKPGRCIGHLLGHKGGGSLLSKLKLRGWVDDLEAGSSDTFGVEYGAKGFGFFKLIAKLTEKGLNHIDVIITSVYQYISLIKQLLDSRLNISLFEELELMSKLDFMNKDQSKPLDMVQQLSECLKRFPARDVMSGPHIWKKFDPNILIDDLKPENMMSMVISKEFTDIADMTEEWYEVKHTVRPHCNRYEEIWRYPKADPDLYLPKCNQLIPKNFTMHEREHTDSLYPTIKKNTPMTKYWFKQDNEFLIPKGCVTIAITSPYASDTPTHMSLLWLMVEMFKDRFQECSYNAALAKLSYNVKPTHYGLELQIYGFTQKMETFFEKILLSLTHTKTDETTMTIMKEKYRQFLMNRRAAETAERAVTKLELLICKSGWTEEELLHSMCELTADHLSGFMLLLFSRIHIEALVFGNFTEESADSLITTMETTLKDQMQCKPLHIHAPSRGRAVVYLPNSCSYTYSEITDTHPSSSVYNYYQFNAEDFHHAMLLELLHQIIKDPCFDTLRTQEQLGYRVRAEKTKSDGVLALLILVQSDLEPEYVNQRIEIFLSSVVEQLQNMSEESYQQHIAGLVSARLARAKNLLDQNNKYWSEIVSQRYHFDRAEIEILFLKKIKRRELVECFLERFAPAAPLRRKLSVRIVSKEHVVAAPALIDPNNNNIGHQCGIMADKILADTTELKKETRFYHIHKPVVITCGK